MAIQSVDTCSMAGITITINHTSMAISMRDRVEVQRDILGIVPIRRNMLLSVDTCSMADIIQLNHISMGISMKYVE